ncbi:hypothetical protein DRJ48_00655, partial [Candidatus Woesearchaeota archaeon]
WNENCYIKVLITPNQFEPNQSEILLRGGVLVQSMTQERLLLKNCRYIITQDEKRRVLEHQDILIEGSRVAKIGKLNSEAEILDCSDMLVMPGLINLHTHTITNLLRGVSDDLTLKDWLNKRVWPAEAKIDDAYYAGLLTCIESIKSGTTCFMDMGFQLDRIAKAVKQTGIRAYLGYGMIDMWNRAKAEKELKKAVEYVEMFKDEGLIKPTIAPHAPNTCSEYLLKEAMKLAKTHKLCCQCHILETREEAEFVKQKTGLGVVEYLKKIDFLNTNTLGIHLCWLSEQEAEILAKHKCCVAHCPVSNMKLASGARAPVDLLLKLGVRVGLGTDSNASNNNLDMFEEMKQTALLHKFMLDDSRVMPAQTILDMATVTAGNILSQEIGTIKPGFLADIIAIPLNNPKMVPHSIRNIISHVVYSCSGSDVHHAIINGRLVMKHRQLTLVEEHKLIASVQHYFESRRIF